MSLYRSEAGYWRSPLLDAESWLDHAFGTAQTPPPFSFLTLKQVHGTSLVEADAYRPECEGDALVSRRAGQFIAVKSADCIPLLLADPQTRTVAAVHGGWRGVQAGIAAEVVARLAGMGVERSRLVAAIGPCIRACCFQVGPEVAILFQSQFPERDNLSERTQIDLVEATRRQLRQAGLSEDRIRLDGPCTVCGGEEFYSWRRDRKVGARMFSAIGLRA